MRPFHVWQRARACGLCSPPSVAGGCLRFSGCWAGLPSVAGGHESLDDPSAATRGTTRGSYPSGPLHPSALSAARVRVSPSRHRGGGVSSPPRGGPDGCTGPVYGQAPRHSHRLQVSVGGGLPMPTPLPGDAWALTHGSLQAFGFRTAVRPTGAGPPSASPRPSGSGPP